MVSGQLLAIALIIISVLVVIKVASKKQDLAVKSTLILFVLFMLSMAYIFFAYKINLTSIDGVIAATKIYFSWMGNLIHNVVRVSGYAINQDWGINVSVVKNITG